MVKIYTDGSNVYNGKPYSYGGYGYVIINEGIVNTGGGHMPVNNKQPVTNNRAELMAIITSLENLPSYLPENPKIVKVYSDSQWCVKTINGEWKMKKNLDLWRRFNKVKKKLSEQGTILNVQWVKGHVGDEYNELADQTAGAYCKMKTP